MHLTPLITTITLQSPVDDLEHMLLISHHVAGPNELYVISSPCRFFPGV